MVTRGLPKYCPKLEVTTGGKRIEQVREFRYFGFYINEGLDFQNLQYTSKDLHREVSTWRAKQFTAEAWFLAYSRKRYSGSNCCQC